MWERSVIIIVTQAAESVERKERENMVDVEQGSQTCGPPKVLVWPTTKS